MSQMLCARTQSLKILWAVDTQWRSQGLPGWATCSPEERMKKAGNMKQEENEEKLNKNQEHIGK